MLSTCQADINSSAFLDFIFDNSHAELSNASDIKYIETEINPDKTWQFKRKTKAWIDVVGYTGMIQYNGTFYINKPHTDAAYIMHEVRHTLGGKYRFDSLTSGLSSTDDSGNVSVKLHTKLYYYYYKNGTRRDRSVENKFYHAGMPPPEQFPEHINVENMTIIVYNDSIKPKSIIQLNNIDYTIGYRIEMLNESIEYYYNILEIEHTRKNFPYGNVTEFETNPIYENSDVFSRVNDVIILNTTDHNDLNNRLKIFVITPYEELPVNFTVSNYSSGPGLTKMEMSSLFSILMMGWFIVFLIKRMRM